ncbi:MAG TPA: type I secretion C-terminal target domain-containing protein [Trichocoleus sp.]|jgi:Ca2+-binding RTX toxin-like protein
MTLSKLSVAQSSAPHLPNSSSKGLQIADASSLFPDPWMLTDRIVRPLAVIGDGDCPPGVTLVGTGKKNVLRGINGSDNLRGGRGNDTLLGKGCQDNLLGEAGNDRLKGGTQPDRLLGGTGRDGLEGGNGRDDLSGGAGNDSLFGGEGDDLLEGGSGDDRLNGGNGKDSLQGGVGRDLLVGASKDDILIGGLDKDRMEGGDGKDRFVYASFDDRGDAITDFNRREDVIDLSRLIRGSNYSSSDRFERYVIVARATDNRTIIRVDADGDSGDNPFKTLVTLEDVKYSRVKSNNFVF